MEGESKKVVSDNNWEGLRFLNNSEIGIIGNEDYGTKLEEMEYL